jgi:hypothetical protein
MDQKHTVVLATPAPISHRTAEENLGLGYLASVLRKHGYLVTIIDGWLAGLSPEAIAEAIFGINDLLWIGFACYRSNMERAMETVRILKSNGCQTPIVAGGYGPTFHAGEFLKAGVDVVVRGEGEETVLELCTSFKEGKPGLDDIQGISFLRNGVQVDNHARRLLVDVDSLPFPARDTISLAIKRRTPVHIISSRGCAAHCLFCSIVSFMRLSHGPQWRQRTIKNFVDEIEELVEQGARYFKIIDDSLLEPPRDLTWCMALADEINRRGLKVRLRGSVRADRIDEAIVSELSRAGFFAFSCGIENFSQSALTRMAKTATLEQNLAALAAFRKHNMYIQAGHILFDSGTTMPELWQNLHGMRNHIWTISKGTFSEMFASEGTPYTRLLDKKALLERDVSGLGNHKYPVLDPLARNVYYGLKKWHKSHMKIYDKTIDAISAPKALDPWELELFHPLCITLRAKDLDLLERLLLLAERNETEQAILDFVETEIERERLWYQEFDARVDQAYTQVGLVYDAEENPFFC